MACCPRSWQQILTSDHNPSQVARILNACACSSNLRDKAPSETYRKLSCRSDSRLSHTRLSIPSSNTSQPASNFSSNWHGSIKARSPNSMIKSSVADSLHLTVIAPLTLFKSSNNNQQLTLKHNHHRLRRPRSNSLRQQWTQRARWCLKHQIRVLWWQGWRPWDRNCNSPSMMPYSNNWRKGKPKSKSKSKSYSRQKRPCSPNGKAILKKVSN